MADIVEDFFTKKYEEKVNKNILYYTFSHDEVKMYVERVISEPLDRYVAYIKALSEKEAIKAEDVFQFSSIEDATDNFCEKLKAIDNPGLTHLEVGKLLQDDGKERKDGAYVKYGENHSKMAKELGLAFELCNTYYLSGIGYIYTELTDNQKQQFLTRMILRSKLVVRLFQASQNGNVNMREFLYMLADSTYIRRRSNIKKVVDYLIQSNDEAISIFVESIKM